MPSEPTDPCVKGRFAAAGLPSLREPDVRDRPRRQLQGCRDLSWHGGGNGVEAVWKGSRCARYTGCSLWVGGQVEVEEQFDTQFQSFDEGNISFEWSP